MPDEMLEREILKLLAGGPMHAGDIRNRLNGFPMGLDASQNEVESALDYLFQKGQVAHDQRLHFGAPVFEIMHEALWSLAKTSGSLFAGLFGPEATARAWETYWRAFADLWNLVTGNATRDPGPGNDIERDSTQAQDSEPRKGEESGQPWMN